MTQQFITYNADQLGSPQKIENLVLVSKDKPMGIGRKLKFNWPIHRKNNKKGETQLKNALISCNVI